MIGAELAGGLQPERQHVGHQCLRRADLVAQHVEHGESELAGAEDGDGLPGLHLSTRQHVAAEAVHLDHRREPHRHLGGQVEDVVGRRGHELTVAAVHVHAEQFQ